MKFFILAMCILPAVLSAPDRRFIDFLFGANAFDLTTLKCDIQIMLDAIGTDPKEQLCEDECHNILQEGHVLNYGCPLVCHGFQTLAHTFHLTPDTTDPSVNPCKKISQTQ
ncbi:uncharacterized protein LOC123526304 [Mercenaria mercenaria]|uniref:uncharacterized protein LOC123526304 n=1 Tax=Mercenaria mercenaria TaxID=6596 RepID=UPI001E1DFE85|nr:uncharacterized protein LOC123526304 [Mercenaria mercenaria]